MCRLSRASRSLYYSYSLRGKVERAAKDLALPDPKVYEQYIIQDENGLRVIWSEFSPLEPLADDIRCGEKGSVANFLNFGVDPNSYTLGGQRMLSLALQHFQEEIAELLLQKGADPSLSDIHRPYDTPLCAAARSSLDNMARRLLEAGSDPAKPTVIHELARHCSLETIQMAIAKGADIFAIHPEKGTTVLHSAVKNEDYKVVPFFLASGLDGVVSRQNNRGRTCLWKALRLGNQNAIRMILDSRINVHLTDDDGETALHKAALWGRQYAVRRLLEAGAQIDQRGLSGRTEPFCAVLGRNANIVTMLLAAGCDPRLRTTTHQATLLHVAAVSNNLDILKMLLGVIPDLVDTRDHLGRTVEMMGSSVSRPEISKIVREFKNGGSMRCTIA
ncbi:hypothetical protein VTN00DRAFT_1174 [Thermoascus crustaceus]|uniref:uncharacterized protein n=1 Tax=Thermoascus crustaceus TaxID=5088 RepID=UPI003743567B